MFVFQFQKMIRLSLYSASRLKLQILKSKLCSSEILAFKALELWLSLLSRFKPDQLNSENQCASRRHHRRIPSNSIMIWIRNCGLNDLPNTHFRNCNIQTFDDLPSTKNELKHLIPAATRIEGNWILLAHFRFIEYLIVNCTLIAFLWIIYQVSSFDCFE